MNTTDAVRTDTQEPSAAPPKYLQLPDLTEEAVRAAAKWWADAARGGQRWDNGDVMHGAFAGLLQESSAKKITPEMVDQFETNLVEEILRPIERHSYESRMGDDGEKHPPKPGVVTYTRSKIDVDYHPSGVLRAALARLGLWEAGKNKPGDVVPGELISNMMPCKTNMSIEIVGVNCSAGYGSAWKPIWSACERLAPPELQVVARWRDRGFDRGRFWRDTAGEPVDTFTDEHRLVYAMLDPETAAPQVALFGFRGLVNCERLEDYPESALAYACSQILGQGYLALAVPA